MGEFVGARELSPRDRDEGGIGWGRQNARRIANRKYRTIILSLFPGCLSRSVGCTYQRFLRITRGEEGNRRNEIALCAPVTTRFTP